MKKLIACISLIVAITGCATYQPVPKDYTGPVAAVEDTGRPEDGTKSQIFALVQIDGQRIDNAFVASGRASSGRGFALTTVYSTRLVPIKPMKASLRASHTTAAPILAIASQLAGSFYSVEGEVDFTPEAGRKYLVKGELTKDKSSVWIEDAESGKPVTAVVSK
jgi:hypothetical protein